jgi:hypothetical protein
MNAHSIRPPWVRIRSTLVLALTLMLSACGGGGGGDDDNDGAGAGPANVAPTANAGADRSATARTVVQLSGATSTDADGTIARYAWQQTVGPTVSLSNAAIVNPSFTAPSVASAAVLSFSLMVTDDDGASRSDSVSITVTPVALTPLSITALELAQTHVLPPQGKSWTLTTSSGTTRNETLHFTGGRSALAIVGLSAANATSPVLEGLIDGVSLGSVALQAPSALPITEDAGPAYAANRYSATIPANWMRPGLQLRAAATNYSAGPSSAAITVGGDFTYRFRVLPFYVFGANENNTGGRTLAAIGTPDAAIQQAIHAKWPIAILEAANHPAGKVVWPRLVIGPRNDSGGVARAAYVADATDDYLDGFAGMSAQIAVLGRLLSANGEAPLAVQYYAPLLALNAAGQYRSAGGGLGGGSVGVGDELYRGIFIHEQGHAFGIPHVGDAFDDGEYPYEWGSLAGSNWGFDVAANLFLPPFIPPTADSYVGCASDTYGGHPRAIDGAGRCIKQDPMQSGSGDQSSSQRYATFSDYSNAIIQRWFEGVTTVAAGGSHSYSGGKLVRDASFAGGYKRWDTIDRAWVNVDDSTTGLAQGGFNKGLPVQRDVPVYSIALTISKAGTPGATQIYPPLRYTGNLLRTIDATDTTELASITPGGSAPFRWYCINSGCDYTLRITYAGGSQRHVLLKGGFRAFNNPGGAFPASATNPVDSDSFDNFVVNVPGDLAITRIDLLNTPMAWTAAPTILSPVLATYP